MRQQIAQGINPAIERKKEKNQIKETVREEKRIAKGEAHPLSVEAVALDWLEDVRKTWKQSTYDGEKTRIIRHIRLNRIYVSRLPSYGGNLAQRIELPA